MTFWVKTRETRSSVEPKIHIQINKKHTNLPHKPNNERGRWLREERWVKKGDFKRPTSNLQHASGAFRPGADIFEQRLPGGSRGGRPDTQSSCHRGLALAPGRAFFTFQCSFSGFRRPFSRSQSRFFGFQSQSLKSLAPRCPPGSTLEHFGHQFGISFQWFRLLFWWSF